MRHPVLVVGNGTCAGALADNLLSNGIDVILASCENRPAPVKDLPIPRQGRRPEVLPGASIIGCSGTAGKFKVLLRKDHKRITRTVAVIAVAEDCRRQPNYTLYRLTPGPSVLCLTRILELTSQPPPDAGIKSGGKIAFLSGLLQESSAVLSGDILQLCLRLQRELKQQVYVLTGNLKVAGPGLEALQQQSKSAGVVYFKFSRSIPLIEQKGGGPVTILFEDEITGHHYRLKPDLTVVDETILPSPSLTDLADIFKVDRGPEGFIQTDNVRRTNVFTNRSGILAVGPSGGIRSEKRCRADADAAALAVAQLLASRGAQPRDGAVIDPDRCIRCLTCYRLCPHGAVALAARPVIAPESCTNCGLCAAACPRRAIAPGAPEPQWAQARRPTGSQEGFEPHLAALCCSRSAIPAWKLSQLWRLRQRCRLSVLPVSCAAGISSDLIYHIFCRGADGVLILSCHPGNCQSEQGPRRAQDSAERIRDFFERIGLEKDRLLVSAVAANMGFEFSDKVAGFAETIRKMGPVSNLKSQISDFGI